ncbi:MAG TPA: RNA polymerase sigma factor [Planctomycetota bacterium]
MRGAAPDPRPDAELLAAVGRGDANAFDELYRRHRDWVVRLAQRFTGSDSDACDVLQETFLYLLRRAPALDLRVRMTTLLWPVVRNLALERRRKQAGQAPEFEPLAADPPVVPPEELLAALGNLPAEQRQALLLRFVDGLSLQEVATAQQVPLGTVKSRLHQALASLRNDPVARRYFLD